MKITIVSSSDSGGAGIAALRLHKALMAYGVDSSMLCLHKATNTPKVYEYKRSFLSKVVDHLPFIPYKQNKYKKYYKNLELDYITFSFPEAIFDISNHPLIQQADIINLHWVGSILDYPRFFRNVEKPVVWTLHDNNPFLGIAHYRKDKEKNQQYKFLEDRVASLKADAIRKHPNVSVVNLCNWMKMASSQSSAFSDRIHTIIPNSIDITTFRIHDQKTIRTELGLPTDKPILLFVSQSVANPWKGFGILDSALKRLERDCFLLVIGECNQENISNRRYVGTVNDEQLMARLYAAADVFLLPTLEDNLPNTMVESLCCGTPVISFSNGGMTDYIHTMKNGILVNEESPEAMLDAINRFLDNQNSFVREDISREAHTCFSPILQAERYVNFFQSILSKK